MEMEKGLCLDSASHQPKETALLTSFFSGIFKSLFLNIFQATTLIFRSLGVHEVEL
jgi:hypothetical protein